MNPTSAATPSEGWYVDPFGRADLRYWSGQTWTEHAFDGGSQAIDPIEPIRQRPATIRPTWDAYSSRLRDLEWWRWIVLAAVAAAFGLIMYGAFGLVPALAICVGTVALIVFLNVLYLRLVYIRASPDGLEVRNQFGVRRHIAGDQIAAVTVGKAWTGGLARPEVVFLVSRAGKRLGRFYLQGWNAADFGLVANALGLRLYGRPDRPLDRFHSAGASETAATMLGRSLMIGLAIGCAIPVVAVVVFIVGVLASQVGRH